MAVVLDSSNLSKTLPAGYYGEIDISTTLNPTGSVKYVHHVHSMTNEDGETIENDSASPESVTSMPESQSESGGCYSKSTLLNYTHATWYDRTNDSHHSWASNPGPRTCPYCGTVVYPGRGGHEKSGYEEHGAYWQWSCNGYTRTVYTCAHGYTNGQVLSAIITY